MNICTHEEFIKKVNTLYPNKDWEVIGKYEHNKTPILLRDKYGDCLIKPCNILQRSIPSVKAAIDKTSYTINKFKEVWGEEKFDYSKFKYKGVRVKSIIICENNHEFLSDANNHLNKRGCPECAKKENGERLRSNTEEFIQKAIDKYGKNKYSFNKTNYVTATENVIITCKKHGDFEQTPNRFLNGQVCFKCSYKESTSNFHELKKRRNNSMLYIIECYNEEERFLKIGVTTTRVDCRFNNDYTMPYNYNILREFRYVDIDIPSKLETQLLRFTKSTTYVPKISFSGKTETRDISIKEELLDLFDAITAKMYYESFLVFVKAYSGAFEKNILLSGRYSNLEVDSVMKGFEIHKNLNKENNS